MPIIRQSRGVLVCASFFYVPVVLREALHDDASEMSMQKWSSVHTTTTYSILHARSSARAAVLSARTLSEDTEKMPTVEFDDDFGKGFEA